MTPFNPELIMQIWDKPFNLDEVIRLRNFLRDNNQVIEMAKFLTGEINRVQLERPARCEQGINDIRME